MAQPSAEFLASMRVLVKSDYANGCCPDCGAEIEDNALRGEICPICSAVLFDLFDFQDHQPTYLREILERFDEEIENGDLDELSAMPAMLQEVEALGFTFDYDLGGTPFNLRVKFPTSTVMHMTI